MDLARQRMPSRHALAHRQRPWHIRRCFVAVSNLQRSLSVQGRQRGPRRTATSVPIMLTPVPAVCESPALPLLGG